MTRSEKRLEIARLRKLADDICPPFSSSVRSSMVADTYRKQADILEAELTEEESEEEEETKEIHDPIEELRWYAKGDTLGDVNEELASLRHILANGLLAIVEAIQNND